MNRKSILPALVLICLGSWFLADNVGLTLPNLGQLWPGFIVLGGLSALVTYFVGANKNPEQIFSGLVALGTGLFFFIFTLDLAWPIIGRIRWSDMSLLWPLFPLISGLAFIGQFVLTGFRKPKLLLPGCVAVGVGVVALPITFGIVGGAWVYRLLDYWPLILILVGLSSLISYFQGRNDP